MVEEVTVTGIQVTEATVITLPPDVTEALQEAELHLAGIEAGGAAAVAFHAARLVIVVVVVQFAAALQ